MEENAIASAREIYRTKSVQTHLLFVFAGAAVSYAQAQSYVSTLADPENGTWLLGPSPDRASVDEEFTLGTLSGTVGSVTLSFGTGEYLGDNFFSVSIFTNASGAPGALVPNGLLSGPASPLNPGLITYTASGLTLNANTSYWLMIQNPWYSIVAVEATGTTAYASSAGWTISGTTDYSTMERPSTYITDSYTDIPLFSINPVTSVPEPSTWAMLAAGAGAVFAFRRRR